MNPNNSNLLQQCYAIACRGKPVTDSHEHRVVGYTVYNHPGFAVLQIRQTSLHPVETLFQNPTRR